MMIADQRLAQRVYLACAPTDMRKSINGLVVLVKEVFDLDPFSPSWFVFCNRQRDKIKILRLLRRRNKRNYSDEFIIPISEPFYRYC
jgi:transposase